MEKIEIKAETYTVLVDSEIFRVNLTKSQALAKVRTILELGGFCGVGLVSVLYEDSDRFVEV